jgi:hypothetical protein
LEDQVAVAEFRAEGTSGAKRKRVVPMVRRMRSSPFAALGSTSASGFTVAGMWLPRRSVMEGAASIGNEGEFDASGAAEHDTGKVLAGAREGAAGREGHSDGSLPQHVLRTRCG